MSVTAAFRKRLEGVWTAAVYSVQRARYREAGVSGPQTRGYNRPMRSSYLWPRLRRLVVLLLVVFALPAGAEDFYSAAVPASSGGEEPGRQQALAAALREVVRQVTGDPEAADSPALEPEYATAARYARQYRFVETPEGLMLEAAFDPGAVDAMLHRHGLAPPARRTTLLLWLAGPAGGGDELLQPEVHGDAWQAANRSATSAGLGMLQPLMDLEDQTRLPAADISARVATTVRDASVRYGTDAVASAYLEGQDGG